MGKARDSSDFTVEYKKRGISRKAKAVGKSAKNLSQRQLEALMNTPLNTLLKGGYSLDFTLRKLEGYKNAEDEAVVLRRSYIPKCFADAMGCEYKVEALERFKQLHDARIKLSCMSYEPRVGESGPMDTEPVPEQAIYDYAAVCEQFIAGYRRKEGLRALKQLERFLTFPHGAIINVDQGIDMAFYADRLCEVFGIKR